jgi:hypothetical protein
MKDNKIKVELLIYPELNYSGWKTRHEFDLQWLKVTIKENPDWLISKLDEFANSIIEKNNETNKND